MGRTLQEQKKIKMPVVNTMCVAGSNACFVYT